MPGESTRICPGCNETKTWGDEFSECEGCDPGGTSGTSDEVDELRLALAAEVKQVTSLCKARTVAQEECARLTAQNDELREALLACVAILVALADRDSGLLGPNDEKSVRAAEALLSRDAQAKETG